MTTVYRTAGAWGAGSGANLTPAQVDTNFYDKETRITAIETAGVAVGIASITVTGDQMTIHMTDSSIQGPFTIPVATWIPKGIWQPATLYNANDVVTYGGSVYLVQLTHTSDATFDPGATLGTAGDIYILLFSSAPAAGFDRTASTFTPALQDANSYNRLTNASGCAVTIDGSIDFADWTEFHFRDESTDTGANCTFASTGGASLNGMAGHIDETVGQGSVVTIKKVGATNVWDLFGHLAIP